MVRPPCFCSFVPVPFVDAYSPCQLVGRCVVCMGLVGYFACPLSPTRLVTTENGPPVPSPPSSPAEAMPVCDHPTSMRPPDHIESRGRGGAARPSRVDEAPGAPEGCRVLNGPLGIPVLVGLTGQADVGMGTTHLKSFWSQILLSKAGRVQLLTQSQGEPRQTARTVCVLTCIKHFLGACCVLRGGAGGWAFEELGPVT